MRWVEKGAAHKRTNLPACFGARTMSARFLAWYTCGILSLASLAILIVSVAPGAEARFAVIQAILAGAALSFAVVAVAMTRLPIEHWSNRSIAVRVMLSVAAISSSMLMAVSAG
jgi:hypothetical protein